MSFAIKNTTNKPVKNDPNVPENILAGCVGAFLFSLAGAVLWVVLSRVGILAGISGLVGVVCAVKGYSIFSKKENKKGIIISVIITVIVLVLASYVSLSWEVYDAFKELATEGLTEEITFFESFSIAFEFLEDAEIAGSYFRDLAIGLALCIVASISYIINYSKGLKMQNELGQPPIQAAENTDPAGAAPNMSTPEVQP